MQSRTGSAGLQPEGIVGVKAALSTWHQRAALTPSSVHSMGVASADGNPSSE